MSFVLDILGSAGFGSLLGGVFGWLGKREERANIKMKFDHELSMIQAKTNAAVEAAKMGIEQSKISGKLAVEKSEAEAFSNSQVTRSSFGEAIKSSIRPLILVVLFIQMFAILSSLEELTGGLQSLPTQEIIDLYRIIILSITGLTATAVGWYFAARSSKQFDKLIDRWMK